MIQKSAQSYFNENLGEWITLTCDDSNPSEILDECSVAEEKRQKMISQLPKTYTHPEIHPDAYYTSRHLYLKEHSTASYFNEKLREWIALILNPSEISDECSVAEERGGSEVTSKSLI
jgi:hypothetical protein